jgi:hypothetical protein
MNHIKSTTSTPIAAAAAEPMLMRRAVAADAGRIWELARLDDKRLPAGPFLVAELAGSIEAAVSLSSGAVVANPFRLTADAVAMLRLRAAQVSERGELAERRVRHSAERRSYETAVAA